MEQGSYSWFLQPFSALASGRIEKRFLPWLDRKGQFSALKSLTLLAMIAPGLWVLLQLYMGWLQPKPITLAIHQIGDWAIRFLVLSLAVTPLRRLLDWPKLLVIRRMVGVSAFVYVAIHFLLYIIDQQWVLWLVASEILTRFYLTIGFVALLGLGALAATSTDKMIKRLGAANWNKLHSLVYILATLGLFHYLIQSKLDISRALLVAGIFVYLMLSRVLQKRKFSINIMSLSGLALASALLTAGLEAVWYAVRNRASVLTILENNFNFLDGWHFSPDFEWGDLTISWWILILGLMILVMNVVKTRPFWTNSAQKKG